MTKRCAVTLVLLGLAGAPAAHGHSVEGGIDPFRPFVHTHARAADILDLELAASPRAAEPELGRGGNGGRAVAHRAGARPDPSAQGLVPTGVHLSTGRPAGEPTIGVGRDGTVYFVGMKPSEDVPISLLQRSRDEGRTWEQLDLLAKGTTDDTKTADPLIYLDPTTDRLFNFDYLPGCSPISFSDDRGETFGQGAACNHTDHQTMFAGPPPATGAKPSGYPNVVYYCAIDGGASVAAAGVTACSKSLDGGTTFQRTGDPAYVTDYTKQEGGSFGIPGFCYGATGHGRVGPDGTVYLPRGMCGTPELAISKDEGATWKRVKVSDLGMTIGAAAGSGIEEHEARVAIDRDGTVYYFWVARDHLPYLAVSRNGGETFGKPLMVAPPGVQEAMLPALALGDSGRVVFSYMATRNSPGGPFCVRTTPSGCAAADGTPGKGAADYAKTTWDGYIGMTTDATAADPLFFTAPVNDPGDPLHRGYCGGIACGATHEFHDVVIGPDGTPWASFVDGATADAAKPSVGPGVGIGIAGRLVGGSPLVGSAAEQRPDVVLPSPRAAAGARRCVSRRRFRIRLREPRRGRLVRASVFVNGKRVRVVRGRRLRSVVDLRGLPRGRFTVRVVATTSTGREVTRTRRYRTCEPRRR